MKKIWIIKTVEDRYAVMLASKEVIPLGNIIRQNGAPCGMRITSILTGEDIERIAGRSENLPEGCNFAYAIEDVVIQ